MTFNPTDYEFVAASQTNQVLGPRSLTTKKGDVIVRILIIPLTNSPGAVSVKDGSGAAMQIYAGGVGGVTANLELRPIPIDFGKEGMRSAIGSWQVTTGANVTALAIGRFT